ncbi:winged helix-turn-helix domain-containing protein [Paraglaciecola sp.]|uniref:winged helix-turn-helix domain-containing protein n=1 Tax=Paraglaciecola sp. TaxID=1920173 RepID=UPI003EF46584
MIKLHRLLDQNRLRRMALVAQGLAQAKPFGQGLVGAKNAIKHLGYVQLDTISVIERAHHHTLYSRVPKFKSEMTNQLLLNKDIFEYWSHAAAFLPIEDFRFSLPYKHAIKSGQTHWYKNPDKKMMAEVLARIKTEGPLRSRDLETQSKQSEGWWDWKPAKKAIEQLYMQGDVMVCDRTGFQKTYDLTERVLPANINTCQPSLDEFAEHLVEQQLRCHGFVSLKGFTYLRKNKGLRQAVKTLVSDKISQGKLLQFQTSNQEIFITTPEVLEQPLPRINTQLKILSPFDNAVIQRNRLKAVFNFDYQIECYVPEAKRQYGYFSLPLLYQGEFVGRMDCKAHRKTKHLEIKSLNFEPIQFDVDTIVVELVKAVKKFQAFQLCDSVSVTRVEPHHLTSTVCEAFLVN